MWRTPLRNLDQTLISPSSNIGLSWNLVSKLYSCSSWIWRWDCQSEFLVVSSAVPNRAGQKTGEKIPVLCRFHRRVTSLWSVVRSSWNFVRNFSLVFLQSGRLDCWSERSAERYTPRTEHPSLCYPLLLVLCFTLLLVWFRIRFSQREKKISHLFVWVLPFS